MTEMCQKCPDDVFLCDQDTYVDSLEVDEGEDLRNELAALLRVSPDSIPSPRLSIGEWGKFADRIASGDVTAQSELVERKILAVYRGAKLVHEQIKSQDGRTDPELDQLFSMRCLDLSERLANFANKYRNVTANEAGDRISASRLQRSFQSMLNSSAGAILKQESDSQGVTLGQVYIEEIGDGISDLDRTRLPDGYETDLRLTAGVLVQMIYRISGDGIRERWRANETIAVKGLGFTPGELAARRNANKSYLDRQVEILRSMVVKAAQAEHLTLPEDLNGGPSPSISRNGRGAYFALRAAHNRYARLKASPVKKGDLPEDRDRAISQMEFDIETLERQSGLYRGDVLHPDQILLGLHRAAEANNALSKKLQNN